MHQVEMGRETSIASQAAHFAVLDRVMALAEFDLDGRLRHANSNYRAILGLEESDWQQRTHRSFCMPQLADSERYAQIWRSLCAGEAFSGVVQRVRNDGSHCWLEAQYAPVRDAQGAITHIVKVATDITQRKEREQAQQAQLRRLSLVAEATDTAIVVSDAQSRIVYVNEGFTRMFGWTLEDITDRGAIELLAPHKSEQFIDHYRHELRSAKTVRLEEIVVNKQGQRCWAKVISNPVCDEDGAWEYTVTVLTDITSTKMHEVLQHRVMEAMARDRPLIEVLEMVCEEVERIAPEVAASILRVDAQGLLHPLAGPSLPFSYSSMLDGVAIGPNVGSCGTSAWLKQPVLVSDIAIDPLWEDYRDLVLPLGYRACWSSPILDKDGEVIGTFAFYYRDAGVGVASEYHRQLVDACTHLCALAMEREQARLRIRQLAFYDALTGLPNRSLLQAKAEQVLATAERADQKAAVLFIDLDRFKQVNDSLGHPAGDELLCVVASRVKEVLRSSDIAGRLSGDEFVVVLPECSSEDVGVVIERLQGLLSQPLNLQDTSLAVSASIGVAMFPQDGRDMETLLHRADMAMYQAKSSGRGRFSFFSSEMNRLTQERLALENALRQALNDGDLHLHYQPQVEMETGRLYGVEALARWRHPTLGDISPARFIPLAEECGLIADLGRWALTEACRQLSQWRAQGLNVPCVAVNLSPSNFHNLDLPHMIADTLQRNALEPADLTLELTESILLDTNISTMKTIEAVHAQGIRLSMDDFGTGYSSLSYLRRLPVSELKLDRSFVADLETDEAARALSTAILGIGRSLSLTVVAEGVETAGQNIMLREQGYPVAQGYLFSRPLSARDFVQWLQEHTVVKSVG